MTTKVCTSMIQGVVVPLAAGSAALTLPGPSGATTSGYQLSFNGGGNTIIGPAVTCDAVAFNDFVAANGGVCPSYVIPLN